MRVEAYNKLGVTPEDVALLPQISPILKQSFRHGISDAIGFLRTSPSPEAQEVIRMYETITPRQRTLVPFEAYCLAASVTPVHLFGIIAEACVKYSLDASRLIAAANHPDVVKATVANALTPLGEGDRKMLHMHSGFVPVPKNQTVINQFQPGASQTNTQNNTQALIQNSQTNFNPNEVNTIENRMSKITDRYNQRMGIAPSTEAVEAEAVVDAEVLESNGSNESEEDWS